jgi:two-component system sensor histidine kinase GlrK
VRVASRLFVASSLMIVVVAAVGALSLRAVGRLVSVNANIATRALPAVRHTADVHDAVLGLTRLEARFLVLGDMRYVGVWNEQAARVKEDLDGLQAFTTSRAQRAALKQAMDAFDEYRQVVGDEQTLMARGDRAGAQRIAEARSRVVADRLDAVLDALTEATQADVASARAEAAHLEARTWAGVLLSLAAAFGLALVGTALIAHRLTRSLRALSTATAAVASGSFSDPVPVQGRDEVADLARSFNAMAAQLRELDELKESFLATVSHELRSPLTSVREAAHLLSDGVPGELNPKQARLVAIIAESSERLLRLVNQLLELSRLRAGMLPLERHPVDLDAVVGRALDELRPQADEARVTLERERRGESLVLDGDEDRLVQVVVNLVANAIRFTPAGGRVTTRVAAAGDEIELIVEDSGVGIPAAVLPRIFEWYRQAHRGSGGSGLGLAIVRGIVEAHGGRVTVESHEGKGSRFTVLLPRRRGEA